MFVDVIKIVFIVITGLVLTLLFLVVGWYILWKVFFSRFSFLRELILGQESEPKRREAPDKDKPIEMESLSRRRMQNVTF